MTRHKSATSTAQSCEAHEAETDRPTLTTAGRRSESQAGVERVSGTVMVDWAILMWWDDGDLFRFARNGAM